jgi:hypothetical protein
MKKTLWNKNKKYYWFTFLLFLIVGCSGSESAATVTPEILFVPPTSGSSSQSTNQTNLPPPTQQTNCRNQLRFEKDLTIPDGTEVLPREKISKRWLITNDGSCNWDQSYTFQLISGLALGADKIQHLYPARQGTQAVIEIVFTAPRNSGRYNSWWQAFDSQGNRFGDPIYMDIIVLSE